MSRIIAIVALVAALALPSAAFSQGKPPVVPPGGGPPGGGPPGGLPPGPPGGSPPGLGVACSGPAAAHNPHCAGGGGGQQGGSNQNRGGNRGNAQLGQAITIACMVGVGITIGQAAAQGNDPVDPRELTYSQLGGLGMCAPAAPAVMIAMAMCPDNPAVLEVARQGRLYNFTRRGRIEQELNLPRPAALTHAYHDACKHGRLSAEYLAFLKANGMKLTQRYLREMRGQAVAEGRRSARPARTATRPAARAAQEQPVQFAMHRGENLEYMERHGSTH
jgi:hypothetical protein